MSEYLSKAQNRYFILRYGKSYSTSSLQTSRTWDYIYISVVVSKMVATRVIFSCESHKNHETYEFREGFFTPPGRRTPRKKIFITFIGYFRGENKNNTHIILHTKNRKVAVLDGTLFAKHNFLFLSGIC